MQEVSLFSELAAGKINAERIAARIPEDINLIESVFLGIYSKLPRVKFGCSKSLLLLSEKQPELLYGKMDRIIELFDSENRILKWSAIAILGNLAAVDREGRIKGLLRKFYGFLSCGELITANNAILALGKIGCAFPGERSRISAKLIGIERATFDTAECRNIAVGKALLAIDMYSRPEGPGKPALEFAHRQTHNTRPATAKKAIAFVRKYSRQSAVGSEPGK